jgi:hypothetical protein
MKTLCTLSISLLMLSARAQIEMVPGKEAQAFFPDKQSVQVIFHNPTTNEVFVPLRVRLYQESSSTTMPVAEAKEWKKLRVLPGQTLLETIELNLPEVTSPTAMEAHWTTGTNEVGQVRFQLYPKNLLKSLATLAGAHPIGVLDPDNQIKPLLKLAGVTFHDLESGAGFGDFEGSLVIVGPFPTQDSLPNNLQKRIQGYARTKASSIVWIRPEGDVFDPLLPLHLTHEGMSTIAVLHPQALKNLQRSPQAQRNLIRAAELSVHPESVQLRPQP